MASAGFQEIIVDSFVGYRGIDVCVCLIRICHLLHKHVLVNGKRDLDFLECVYVCVLVFWVSIFCKDLWWWLMVMVVGNGDCFGGKWCGGKGFEK